MYKFTSICCICLNNKAKIKCLNDGSDKGKGQILIHKMNACAFDNKWIENDFPILICYYCENLINIFYDFKLKCAENNLKLRNYILNLKQINKNQNEQLLSNEVTTRQYEQVVNNFKLEISQIDSVPEYMLTSLSKFCEISDDELDSEEIISSEYQTIPTQIPALRSNVLSSTTATVSQLIPNRQAPVITGDFIPIGETINNETHEKNKNLSISTFSGTIPNNLDNINFTKKSKTGRNNLDIPIAFQSKYDRREKLICSICDQRFRFEWSLVEHGSAKHKEFFCIKCSLQFSDKKSWRFHLRNEHNRLSADSKLKQIETKKKACSFCKRTFASNKKLAKHVTYVHTRII